MCWRGAGTAQKDRALAAMASAIRAGKSEILAANAADLADGKASVATPAFFDRLTLNDKRVAAMAEGSTWCARWPIRSAVPIPGRGRTA